MLQAWCWVLTVLLGPQDTLALTKVWTPDQRFDNENNWSPRRVPCSEDRIIFPENLIFGLRILTDEVWVKEVVLPRNGKLGLTRTGNIRIGSDSGDTSSEGDIDLLQGVSDCVGQDMFFKKDTIHAWSDAANWQTVDQMYPNEGGPAVPHLERLPCVDDEVFLESYSGGLGHLPEAMQKVMSIHVDGIDYSNNDWKTFESQLPVENEVLSHTYGSQHIWITGSSNYMDEAVCQTNPPPELCEFNGRNCASPHCLDPVKPYYHCCKICGAIILIGSTANKTTIKDIASDVLQYKRSVRWWVGVIARNMDQQIGGIKPALYNAEWTRSTHNLYQLIIVDKEQYSGLSTELAVKVKDHLKEILNLTEGTPLKLSGMPWLGADAPPTAWEAGLMLLIVLIVFAAIYLYYYPPVRSARAFSSFDFARFDNRSREGSLVLGVSQLSLDKEFDNPMFAEVPLPKAEKTGPVQEKVEEYEVKEPESETSELLEEDEEDETTFRE